MQKLQNSVFSIVKTTNLSPAVFSFLQPVEDNTDVSPLGGILRDINHGWLALGPKFCVVDLRTGLKIAARTFGNGLSSHTFVTSVVELPSPLTSNTQQLVIALDCEDGSGLICVFHINGSQILRCIQTEVVVTELAVCDELHDGPFTCFDGTVIAGTKTGEIFVFDLNKAILVQALKNIAQGYEHLIQNEQNPANLTFLPLNAIQAIESQRELVLENDDHIAVLLNENSIVDGQYIFRNPDGTVRMKAKRDHIRVTVLEYIPQLGSVAVGYNFGAFQMWNLMTLDLEYTSQVNVECLPVTHFGFQEPCDDPRAFCYLWVVFSVLDRYEEDEFPLAVMFSLTYQGKRMITDTKCVYQDFITATIRFQIDLTSTEDVGQLVGGRCISCHTYCVDSVLGEEGEENKLNLCQLVWECWRESRASGPRYGMLLFDLDQWYKDQMPATYPLQSCAFLSLWRGEAGALGARALSLRIVCGSVAAYSHVRSEEEHFYPASLQYQCICLNTSECTVLSTSGIQRQIIASLSESGPAALRSPGRLYTACVRAGLAPLCRPHAAADEEEQRRYILSIALEARLTRFLKRCAHDWATGTHSGAGCTLPFLVDWCWRRAVELKENAKEITAPLFVSSALPDRNVTRCLEHCVQQLSALTGLLDSVLTKCCNLVVPEALSEIEEKHKGISCVSLYFLLVQWLLRAGLLPERDNVLPYPRQHLANLYSKRRVKLNRLQENAQFEENAANKSCSLLYIDRLIEHEFGAERISEMWQRAGSENGLYPPPSLYSLLHLYLLPDVAEEHKHSLVLYLLIDYSMVYDEVRYEAVIRRLMQFPTMFGLSNTAIKATQAFWHLDHRDFDFALDQLQCLTGNTLSEWQHNVVLSSLLAQKKTQAALQYLHVRKPPPTSTKNGDITLNSSKLNDHDKLEDWQSICNLYLARQLAFEALDVVRMCVQNAHSVRDKVDVLNYFYKGCRNTGQLSKLLQVTLLPFEEEVFIKYLENCNEPQTSDILVMYYLQQARYLEAEQYNTKLKQSKPQKRTDLSTSIESLADIVGRDGARDALVEVVCAGLPAITNRVANCVLLEKDFHTHVVAPKPMSVFVQAKSPKNTFTYKSSFIQDTIENASETWVNRPKMRRGLKRALNIEDTPFICTPKCLKNRSIFADTPSESTPPKRTKLDLSGTPKSQPYKTPAHISEQLSILLDMPEVQSPECVYDRTGAETPHSILKIRRNEREVPSPVDSRYMDDSEDDILETASNHTHYSDSTNKHLRFTIPTASESGSTPSPTFDSAASSRSHKQGAREMETSTRDANIADEYTTTAAHSMIEENILESPQKKLATEENVMGRKTYKDSVRARRSLSISANSSLSEDPNTSIESIADIPITLINPRYSGEKRPQKGTENTSVATERDSAMDIGTTSKTPKGRKSIRDVGESTPLKNRSRSVTPDRFDSPIVTPLRTGITRSRSRTPEVSPRSSPLEPIQEQPKQEVESGPHPVRTTLSVARQLRSRSRTPDLSSRVLESPRLEAIKESPTTSTGTESPMSSPRRNLRSRSRTPEVEPVAEILKPSLRSRSKTPEKIMSPKVEHSARGKKSLSRLVLEANTFSKSKQLQKPEEETKSEPETIIECTPMKTLKPVSNLMDVTFSPIVNKSVLDSSDSLSKTDKEAKSDVSTPEWGLKTLPEFTTLHETYFQKSVLHSYQSSVGDHTESIQEEVKTTVVTEDVKILESIPAFTTLNETGFGKSVLGGYESSFADSTRNLSEDMQEDAPTESSKLNKLLKPLNESGIQKSVLRSCESSVAETSEDNLSVPKHGELRKETSAMKDASSLMTNDSDVEMEEAKEQWKESESATMIQKEKEKIVEIEREINEIEGGMSEDSEEEESNSSGDEEIIEAREDSEDDDEVDEEESDDEESDEEAESESSTSAVDQDVISIADTDESSDTAKLQIDEEPQEKAEEEKSETETTVENIVEINVEKENKTESLDAGSSLDPLNQAHISLLTDDNSMLSEKSDLKLNYSDDKNEEIVKDFPVETELEEIVQNEMVEAETPAAQETKIKEKMDVESKDDIDSIATIKEPIQQAETIIKKQPFVAATETKAADKESIVPVIETDVKEKEFTPIVTESKEKQSVTEAEVTGETEKADKPALRTRKRASSTSSKKSNKDTQETEIQEEPRTPMTRKRTQSTASNKSVTEEPKTPENEPTTPSRRRGKTPTTEVRKILTRRASRELNEKLDEPIDDSILTPKRRSARAKSKTIDDNASVASEASVTSAKSTASKASEASGVKPAAIRRGRKSILSTKPDLSVIPETTAEETGKIEESSDVINEYSNARRLTRHQKSLLESWLEPTASPRRRPSNVSVISTSSEQDFDRISLLNKEDFVGIPDADELQSVASGDSIASDASKQQRLRRAASEAKTVPAKIGRAVRRVSVDIASTPERGSPLASDSPSRGRRASFTRACEALHTPKGRRGSTDVKRDTDSVQSSPPVSEADAPSTPTRRPRRPSNTSVTKTDTGKRSKKTVDESKETKKK